MAHEEEITRLKARVEREKQARKQAEKLLEQKSAELFNANQELAHFKQELETIVHQRTEALEKARDEALKLARTKSQFLANMSHEFKTPLNGILGSLSLLKETALNNRQQYMVDTAENAGESLVRLVNNVLDVSSLVTNNFSLLNISFSPAKVLNRVIDRFQSEARKKSLNLSLNVDPVFPDALKGDPTRIAQILEHLISNAIKFTQRGSIGVNLAYSDKGLQFQVVDTGIGIAADKQHNIFDIFTQADDSFTRDYGGIGLGLTLCQKIATLMGGAISLESKLERGTTVTVTLPLAVEEQAVLLEDEDGDYLDDNFFDDDAQISRHFSGEKVLLVEDNAINQEVARDMLLSKDLQVEIANNGQEALSLLQKNSYDIVLMDVQMPVMDGLEATRRIRKLPAPKCDIPIIALTAHGLQEDREKSLAAGMDAHLTKPIDLPVLTRKIAQYLQATTEVISDPGSALGTLGENTNSPELYGINYQEALARMTGNLGLLEKVLNMFAQQYANFSSELQTSLSGLDRESSIRLLHSLKGSAGNVSANKLSNTSAALEKSLKEQGLTATWLTTNQTAVNDLVQHLQEVLASIHSFYQSQQKQPPENNGSKITDAAIKEKITGIKQGIYEDLSTVQQELSELQSNELPKFVTAELALFELALADLDYGQMETSCDNILGQLP